MLSQPRIVNTARFQLAEERDLLLSRNAAPNNKAEIGELLFRLLLIVDPPPLSMGVCTQES